MKSFCDDIKFSNFATPYVEPMMEENKDDIKYSSYEQFIKEYLLTKTPNVTGQNDILLKLAGVPKMSTYAIGVIIREIVNKMTDRAKYLNIGTWYGYSLFTGTIGTNKQCIGVDDFSQFGGPEQECLAAFEKFKNNFSKMYVMDYIRFFKEIAPEAFRLRDSNCGIGFYFYDGAHDYKSQLQALEIAEPYFNNHCYILVDDINWADPFRATMDFISKRRDYRIIFHQPTNADEFGRHHTFWNGILLIEKGTKP